jgi:hypothetical protein
MNQPQNQRITEILKGYWEALRGDRPFPLESEVDTESAELRSIWRSCFLVKVDYENADRPYHYAYLGDALVKAYGGEDASAREVCETLVYPSTMSLIHKFKDVVESGKPTLEENEFTNKVGELIKFRSELLPLGGQEGSGVGYILGGMKWNAF